MIPVAASPLSKALRTVGPCVVVLVVAAFLRSFPPDQYSFYPRCPIYSLFHLQCPGCGGTRALFALARGEVFEALRLNALVTLALPLSFLALLVSSCRTFQAFSRAPSRSAIYAAFAITVVFTIARNL